MKGQIYIAIRQYNEVIPFNIHKSKDEIPPPIFQNQLSPFLETVAVQRDARVNDIKKSVIKEGLESRDAGPFHGKKRREGICACDAHG